MINQKYRIMFIFLIFDGEHMKILKILIILICSIVFKERHELTKVE